MKEREIKREERERANLEPEHLKAFRAKLLAEKPGVLGVTLSESEAFSSLFPFLCVFFARSVLRERMEGRGVSCCASGVEKRERV